MHSSGICPCCDGPEQEDNEPIWASEAEVLTQLERETFSQEEWYQFEMQQSEIEAEYGWLRAAEASTPEDIAFEQYEAERVDPHFYDFIPGYPTEMDYMNAMEADDYTHEFDDLEGE
jgi:hypothetical protein